MLAICAYVSIVESPESRAESQNLTVPIFPALRSRLSAIWLRPIGRVRLLLTNVATGGARAGVLKVMGMLSGESFIDLLRQQASGLMAVGFDFGEGGLDGRARRAIPIIRQENDQLVQLIDGFGREFQSGWGFLSHDGFLSRSTRVPKLPQSISQPREIPS